MNEPKLRFKADDGSQFPDWEKKPFGDVVSEFKVKTKVEDEDTLLSCAINGVFLNSELFGHQRGQSNVGYLKIKKGTLILSAQNLHLGNANVNMRFEHGMISPAYKTYNIVGCCVEYMNQWVKRDITKQFFYNATTVGASGCRRNVDWEMLYSQLFAVPSLPEQQKIAEFLSTIDTVIAKQKETVSAWEERKKGMMQKLFSQEVRFKADDGSNFPEWEKKKLGDVCKYRKGQSVGVNYVGTENMNQNFSGVDSLDSINEVKGVTYCVGDTLMSNIRPYLKKTWKADRNGVCSTDVLVFRPVNVDSDFLYYNISSEKFVLYVMTGVKGSKMPRGDKGHIMEYDMLIPCLAEQQKIADCLSSLDEVIEKQKATLAAWEELKKGLLQQMFV
ncbi:restriction endonuclease subunit S [Blautia sp. MCC289]|nr:restriction endonuclease subunit S [Blautia sp. MCC289]